MAASSPHASDPLTTTHEEMNQGRLLWNGPLFGRLPKCGREFLVQHGGWKILAEPPTTNLGRLQFAWPNKSGPQFEMSDATAPLVRPYPKFVTDVLDDKVSLAELLLVQKNSCIGPNVIASPDQARPDRLYFVKHRYGAQGKSVYVYDSRQLEEWWQRSKNVKDFVIQEEVIPALDAEGRKFVLRSHILMFQRPGQSLEAYLHEDVICQPHASRYVEMALNNNNNNNNNIPKSSHISQAGKRHPKPLLLEDLPPDHPAADAWPKIASCSQTLMELASTAEGFQQQSSMDGTCFALLGTDLLISRDGEVKVCEVNSHPALGWGTMKQVPYRVFERLIEDTLSTLVMNDDNSNNGFTLIHGGGEFLSKQNVD